MPRGSRVTITVSKGKQKVTIPDVVGLSAADAMRQLRDAKLNPVRRDRKVRNQDENGKVVDERPAGGVEGQKGDTVVIVVGKFTAPKPPTPAPVVPQPTP